MQLQTTGNVFEIAPLLHDLHRHGVVQHFRCLFVGQNAKVQNRGNVFQRHNALKL